METRRAESWGNVWGRWVAQTSGKWPERDQARAEWTRRTGNVLAEGPAFEAFTRAALVRAAAELGAESNARALGEQERAEIARTLRETLALSRSATTKLARAEACRSALRSAIRYGFQGIARDAAEALACAA